MVNEQIDIKAEILKALCQSQGKTVSGVRLSERLNISRVAVWKHIAALKQSGIEIESRPKGYALMNPEDLLLPAAFSPEFQDRIFYFPELSSTMDQAKILARKGAENLSVVVAENQTAGRGRMNRKWISSRGGLWMTVILKPRTPPILSYIYNFAASLSLSRSLRHLFDIKVSVKWPNDLLLNGKKLAGLLSEMETRGDMVEYINIGIGMNVNNPVQADEPRGISLKDLVGAPVSRKLILETFLRDFKSLIHALDCPEIIRLWKQQTSTIGSRVRIETPGHVYEGIALDVDETGALIIQDNTGLQRKIIYGDCFHTRGS